MISLTVQFLRNNLLDRLRDLAPSTALYRRIQI
jgi:hypothetical protein